MTASAEAEAADSDAHEDESGPGTVPCVARAEQRLGYLTSEYPATSHTFIRREVAALREQGWPIETFSIRPSATLPSSTEDKQAAASTYYVLRQPLRTFAAAHLACLFLHPIGYFGAFALALRHRPPGLRGLLLAGAHFAESVVLARELRRRRIGHLHNHFANSAATVGMIAAGLAQVRWSFTMHGISETDYPAGLLLGRKIERADFVACVSWFGRAQGLRLVGRDHWDKLSVVRCGLPLRKRRERQPVARDGNTLICVGRLSPEKGQSGLIQVFASLRSRHPRIRLVLVGDGPDKPELVRYAKQLSVRQHMFFLGSLPEGETLKEIAQADVLVVPSFMEGLPAVLLESIASGVPVVAAAVAGVPELIQHGVNGLLFPASNWSEMETCIDRLLSDPKLRRDLAREAEERLTCEFDSSESARRMGLLFEGRGRG